MSVESAYCKDCDNWRIGPHPHGENPSRQELKTAGKYHTFYFWNLTRLQERRITIWGADEEWCKAAAWELLADKARIPRENVKTSWRLTSILIQPTLGNPDRAVTVHCG